MKSKNLNSLFVIDIIYAAAQYCDNDLTPIANVYYSETATLQSQINEYLTKKR